MNSTIKLFIEATVMALIATICAKIIEILSSYD